MNYFYSLFIIVFLFSSCGENKSTDHNNLANSETELAVNIDEYFSALTGLEKFNGVIYAEKDGKELLFKAYNLYSSRDSSTFVEKNSQFDIHSVSKLMAHYLIEELQIQGKIKKSQALADFITDFPNGDKITIEMLLEHSSGLPRSSKGIEEKEIDLSSNQIIEYAKKQQLIFDPGTDTQYSNVGFQLLYAVIESIEGKSFSQCLQDDLFKSLGMQNSGAHFYVNENRKKNLAQNHEFDDGKLVTVANVLDDETKTARIFSTALDLTKFLEHVKKEPYASLLNKKNVIEKNGGGDGIRVQIYANLEHNYNFILLCNYDGIPFQKTIEDFVKILEGEPFEIPKELNRTAIEMPVESVKKITGVYSFADMGNLELNFKLEKRQFVVYQDGERIASLKAENDSTFFEDPKEAESFEFVKNGEGSYDVLMGWKGVKLKGMRIN